MREKGPGDIKSVKPPTLTHRNWPRVPCPSPKPQPDQSVSPLSHLVGVIFLELQEVLPMDAGTPIPRQRMDFETGPHHGHPTDAICVLLRPQKCSRGLLDKTPYTHLTG